MAFLLTQDDDGSTRLKPAVGSSSDVAEVVVEFAIGIDAAFGRGVVDTDITYVALRNASGTLVFIHPDAAGTAIVVTTTKP